MKHWWVNQNQTYKHEIEGGYLWSPKRRANGTRNPFYDTMMETQTGDVVFSYSDALIKSVGIVIGPHRSAQKPTEFGNAGANWGEEGWLVPVEFRELSSPLRPKEWMNILTQVLPSKYSPLQPNGNGVQAAYLAAVPENMAAELRKLLGGQVETIELAINPEIDAEDKKVIQAIQLDSSIPETTRQQLIKARVGQGAYRVNLERIESCCRVTGITDRRFLRASHIKPWSRSDNKERLDGHNGLMLAPHVDMLFDRGYISFGDNGILLISSHLPTDVINSWHLVDRHPKMLMAEQSAYMGFHREHIYRK